MKKQKIGSILPHIFGDYLIISLSKQWIDHHGKIPSFEIIIDCEGRLCLVGPKVEKEHEL